MPQIGIHMVPGRIRRLAIMVLVATGLAAGPCGRGTAEEAAAYTVEVGDVSGKVGEHAVMQATLRIRVGYRILKGYNNRLIALSSWDDGVDFDLKVVPATVQDEALVFAIGLRPTKPGKHPINGVFRVGYIHGTDDMSMVSMRLIANVTGTE